MSINSYQLELNAKTALEQFLEANKRTVVVAVDNEDKIDCGGGNEPNSKDKGEERVFSFLFPIEDIYGEVHERTSYYGRNMENKEGVSQIDKVAITKDEYDIFYHLCEKASAEVFTILTVYGKYIDSAYSFDNEKDGNISFALVKQEKSFDFNLIEPLKALIKEAIITWIIAKWFRTIRLYDDSLVWWRDYLDAKEKIEHNAKNRKLKKAKRHYRLL